MEENDGIEHISIRVRKYGIFNLMGTLYEHNIVIFPCFNLICECILYMVVIILIIDFHIDDQLPITFD